jgi:HAD superfamily hydrolase (TIGR01509 family)
MTWRELPEVPDGLEAVITNLAADYKLGLVSGRLNQFIGELYQLADVEHHFDVVVGFEDYTHPKPHPEPLLIAAKRLGVKAAEAVYIGDSATDKQAAEAAGMPFIFCSIQPVTWTDESSPTLDQLPELIRKL